MLLLWVLTVLKVESRSASAAYLSLMAEKLAAVLWEGVEVGAGVLPTGVAPRGWGWRPPPPPLLKGCRGAAACRHTTQYYTIIIITVALKGAIRDFTESRNSRFYREAQFEILQSLHCAGNCLQLSPTHTLMWPGCNCMQITCNTLSVYHVQHVMCHVVQLDSSATKFDRV